MKLKFTIPMMVLLLGFALQMIGQRAIKGTVTSSDGDPLIGASIMVKGTSTGVISDLDGKYEIKAKDGDYLVFSYIGFNKQEVKVDGQSMIDVVMNEGVSLNEVVVTALGIPREKKSLGYAVSEVSADELTESGQTNIVSALQGKVAGVQIQTSSGAPGAGASILIRGITSLDPNRSNRPLYIVDGIEISDNTNVLPIGPSAGSNAVSSRTQAAASNRAIDINPEDIESLSILKGAQATALYGIRAANGVIVITTKKGVKGTPKINVHYGQGWENVNKTPKIQTKFIDGHRNTSLQRSFKWDMWGAIVNDNEDNPIRDIYKEFFRTGHIKNYGASVSSGNDMFTYRISADKYNHDGVIPNTYWDKTNFTFSGGSQLTKKLNVSANLMYANTGGNRPHVGDKSILSDLSYMATVVDPTSYPEPYVFNKNFAVGIIDHPLFLARHNTYIDDVHRYISGLTVKYDFSDRIKLQYTIGLDNSSDARTRIVHPQTDEGSKVHGFLVEQNLNESQLTSNLMMLWNYDINDRIKLNGLVGQDIHTSKTKWVSTRGEGFVLDNFYNLYNTTNLFVGNSIVNKRNLGVYGQVTMSYNNYFYLTATGRNDWSSTLPSKNNSYFFPSISASLLLSDMIDMPSFVSLAKLRGSYSIVGKDASPYKIGRYFQRASNFPFGDVVGFSQSTLIGDVNLKPEFTKSTEFGAEINLFNNRFGLDFSYYNNNLEDMILSVPISNATGASRYVTNAGSINSNGIEVAVFANPIKYHDFSWETSITWSKNEGKVTDIAEGIGDIELFSSRGITNKYVKGGNIGDIYGYAYKRNKNGDLIIDKNGYPGVVWDSLKLVGNALPDWTAGWNNQFQYKEFSFSFLWEWKNGGDVFDLGRRNSLRNGQIIETERRHEQVVFKGVNEVIDGDGNVTYKENDVPVELTGPYFYRSSTRYNYASEVLLEDGSWFRLRNISLSYTLPSSLFGSKYIKGATVSFIANNVYLNTPFLGYDPEINYFGSDSNIYGYTGLRNPATKSYFLKLNLNF